MSRGGEYWGAPEKEKPYNGPETNLGFGGLLRIGKYSKGRLFAKGTSKRVDGEMVENVMRGFLKAALK